MLNRIFTISILKVHHHTDAKDVKPGRNIACLEYAFNEKKYDHHHTQQYLQDL